MIGKVISHLQNCIQTLQLFPENLKLTQKKLMGKKQSQFLGNYEFEQIRFVSAKFKSHSLYDQFCQIVLNLIIKFKGVGECLLKYI